MALEPALDAANDDDEGGKNRDEGGMAEGSEEGMRGILAKASWGSMGHRSQAKQRASGEAVALGLDTNALSSGQEEYSKGTGPGPSATSASRRSTTVPRQASLRKLRVLARSSSSAVHREQLARVAAGRVTE